MASTDVLARSFDRRQAIADASGVATITFLPPRFGQTWEVNRITIASDSTLESELFVYNGIIDDLHVEDHSFSGNADVSDELKPIVVTDGPLILQWTGCTVGATCTARINYELISGRG